MQVKHLDGIGDDAIAGLNIPTGIPLVYRLDANLGAAPQAWATRALANDTGHRAGHMAQHVHGGIGVDISYPIHRFLYWSRALNAVLGGTEHQLARLGDWLADNDNLGWKYDFAEDTL